VAMVFRRVVFLVCLQALKSSLEAYLNDLQIWLAGRIIRLQMVPAIDQEE
jgi:hypothetical protein